MDQRVRMQNLGMSLILLGQGVPFLHAGVDLIRSKSLDRNSYNSGDWFNTLDFSYQRNNWGVGLPPATDNQSNWPIFQPLLADPALAADSSDIVNAATHFREMLAIRKSTPLFRLQTGQQVIDHLHFLNTGPSQIPGLIIMSLPDDSGSIDRKHSLVVALINANDETQTFEEPSFTDVPLHLHPIQQASADPIVQTSTFDSSSGTFNIPGRTTAVFIALRRAEDQINLLMTDVNALVADGTLNHVQGLVLKVSLQQALNELARGRESRAISRMQTFIATVWLYKLFGVLPAVQADLLIGRAIDVISTIQQS
jgi:pullulanase/glycogen debranching enzyme